MRIMDLANFAFFIWVGLAGTAVMPAQDEIPWLDNYKEALREARRTQKPILLEFRCEA